MSHWKTLAERSYYKKISAAWKNNKRKNRTHKKVITQYCSTQNYSNAATFRMFSRRLAKAWLRLALSISKSACKPVRICAGIPNAASNKRAY
jgi:hypothetical protein